MSWPSRSISRGWRWPSGAVCMFSCRPSSTLLQPIGSQEAAANQRAASTLALVTRGPRGKWDLRGFLWTKRDIVRCQAHMHYPIFLPQDCQTWGADSGRESRWRLLVVPAWRAIDKMHPSPLAVGQEKTREAMYQHSSSTQARVFWGLRYDLWWLKLLFDVEINVCWTRSYLGPDFYRG